MILFVPRLVCVINNFLTFFTSIYLLNFFEVAVENST